MTAPAELAPWLGFTEDSILLQDGLLRLADLVQAPPEALQQHDKEARVQQILSADTRNISSLVSRLESLCRAEHSAGRHLVQYRLAALKGLWVARQAWAVWQQNNGKSAEEAASVSLRQRKTASHADTATVFSSRLSLLLIFPLIKSQAVTDPGLCSVTAQLLLESLRQCPPLSLKEPADCLDGLEDLLSSWLGEEQEGSLGLSSAPPDSLETSAAALVTLACARNSTKTVLHTVFLLEKMRTISCLPVYDIIYILGALEGGPNLPATLNGSRHQVCWALSDQLGWEETEPDQPAEVGGRSLTTDGSFLYLTNLSGEGLAKVGTGLNGSIRGVVYCRNTQLRAEPGPGFVAFADGVLLHRAYSLDGGESSVLARLVDSSTLSLLEDINIIPQLELELDSPGSVTTLALTTNGMEFYWVRSLNSNSSQFSHLIVLDVFTVDPQSRTVRQFQPRKILSKREESGDKLAGIENILQPKRPIRSSSSHSGLEQSAAGSSQPQNCVKDNNSSSVGLAYKTLVSCPILTCGNYITIISPPASASTPTSQLSRSLFSSTAGMSKILAVSNTFSVKDGLFNSRTDLSDAQHSAFNKGVPLSNMSATFDTFNNCIWTASPDYVDQFFNPGHPAATFTARRLGIDISDKKPTTTEDNMASVQQIISTLIEHTGLMCCHYMSNELFLSASNILSDRVVDINHLRRVLQLLEEAVIKRDEKSILCQLVVTQYIMKTSNMEKLTESEKEILPRLERLLWEICKSGGGEGEPTRISREACNTIIAALGPLYPSNQQKNELLFNLLMKDQREPGLCLLKDLMLNKYSKVFFQSKEENISRKKSLRGALNLNSLILKKTFAEGSDMIDKITSLAAEADFTRFFYSIPSVSPGLRYISCLVSSLLADLIDKAGAEDVKEDREVFDDISDQLFDSSHSLLDQLSRKVEQVCSDYSGPEQELRLSSVDKILKSSIISHVFLPLATTMLDPAINSLEMCENTIFKLVQLFDLTCKISQRIERSEDKDFMSKIKIPTPWAAGKILESCHPLRDNYKFKETIKIPGARCLFIKFDPRCSSQYDYDKLVLHAG